MPRDDEQPTFIFVGFGTGGSNSISYSYDAGDRLIQAVDSTSGTITRSYDGLDRLISETTPQGAVSYSYDAAGRRTSMSVSGQSAISYSYDNANRLTQITQGSFNVTIVPDSDSRRQSLTLPNGVKTSYSYDAASQLTGITYSLGSNTLGNLSYAYDFAGRRTNVGGSFARTGVPQAVSSATYNVNNQLTNWKGTGFTYDANGNLTNDGTNTYNWNARNQLVSISGAVNATFQYDAFGRRVSKTIGGTTQFLYDGVNPVQEISGSSASANLLTGGVDEYFQRTDSAGAREFLTDVLGNTLALTDSTGAVQTSYTFEPFGNSTISGSSTTNSFAFTGRELDPTGLYYFRARFYLPTTGRFLSEDPIRLASESINFYTYAYGDPARYRDPFGTDPVIGATVGLIEGGIFGAVGAIMQGGSVKEVVAAAAIGAAVGGVVGAVSDPFGITALAVLGGTSGGLGDVIGQVIVIGSSNGCKSFNIGSTIGAVIGGAIGGALGGAVNGAAAASNAANQAAIASGQAGEISELAATAGGGSIGGGLAASVTSAGAAFGNQPTAGRKTKTGCE